jgi:two-component system NarL family sensor kinase
MRANDPLDPGRERLVPDLATQAGPVLRNVRLIEELRASRQRLVAARDEERHRLERNITTERSSSWSRSP